MYYVYILKLTSGMYYSGFTKNLRRRIAEHKRKEVNTTRKTTFELISYTAFKNKSKAVQYERYLKRGSGVAFRNKHLI